MTPRTKSALLWSGVSFLAFLVAVQGSVLVGEPLSISTPAIGVVAVVVAALTAGIAYVMEHRLRTKGRT